MKTKYDGISGARLWIKAQRALKDGRLREAKEALDELGLRFDDAYESLESQLYGNTDVLQGKVWS